MGFPSGQIMQIMKYFGGDDVVQNVTVVHKNAFCSVNV
jgi:hypothetical protein